MEKKTPLYESHLKCGGKMVPFAGYLLPVQYKSGIIAEHIAVRTKCGLFDVSHMGEILCRGRGALDELNYLLTNDYTNLAVGGARYSPMCNKNGGVVDDLIVYKIKNDEYLIVVNAANRQKDYEHIIKNNRGTAEFEDISDSVSQLALQGPLSRNVMLELTAEKYLPEKFYTAVTDAYIKNIKCMISWTGYTGEDGFEIYCGNDDAPELWDMLLKTGEKYGIVPCGLGARDTLRLEAAMPLYGHELSEELTPAESGISLFVKKEKPDFIGKDAILKQGVPKNKRVGLKVVSNGIARENMTVYAHDKVIGKTTSGTRCPYIGAAVAMAIIDRDYAEIGSSVQIDVRGKLLDAEVIKLPFYKKGQSQNELNK